MALVKTIQDFSHDAFMSALLPFDTTAGTHAGRAVSHAGCSLSHQNKALRDFYTDENIFIYLFF